MGKSTKNSLTAIVYGMDNRSREALKMAFSGPGKGCCLLSDDAQVADIAIINMDSVDAKELLQKIRQEYPQRHTIVLSVNDPQLEDTHYVARPICMEAMASVIRKVRQLPPLESKPVVAEENRKKEKKESPQEHATPPNSNTGAPPAPPKRQIPKIDFSQPALQGTYCYDPDNYLQGKITKAIKQSAKKNIALQISIRVGGEWKMITILPESKKVLTSINSTLLKRLCTSPAYTLEVKVRYHNKKNSFDLEYRATEKKAGIPIDTFLWRVAFWASQGRVPSETDLKTPVYLKQWPNVTRLATLPNAMRIITLLIDKPRELPLVSQVLGVPYKDVFALYSAAHAIGLAGPAHRKVDTLIQPQSPKPHRLHSLFGKILDKFKGSE